MNNNFKIFAVGVFIFLAVLMANIFNVKEISSIKKLFNYIELGTFDHRQKFTSEHKEGNKDIIAIGVDDESFEHLGGWPPASRKLWADLINYIEQANPKSIAFDLLFLKPSKHDSEGDREFINAIKNYDNVYLVMNFDVYSEEVRKAPILDEKFKLKITEGSLKDNNATTFSNARMVMKEIADITDNIGSITTLRDDDGIIRTAIPIFKYKDDYYPNFSLKIAMDYLGIDSIKIKNNSIILDENHSIPLDETNRVILNWYKQSYISPIETIPTHPNIKLWEVIKASEKNDKEFLKKFENKTIYIGTAATSMYDIKSVPIRQYMAGVETHTTFLNNLLDNNFIKKAPFLTNLLTTIFFTLLVVFITLKTKSALHLVVYFILSLGIYVAITYYAMLYFNLWLNLIYPLSLSILALLTMSLMKYILKSKDYEQAYKLAVTDGLTQLYNHRFFQEQMINNCNGFFRYGVKFSLILIDIDFFKKFNDKYGHQSGDAVLKQVAALLKKNSRTSDLVCRYGGEEMAIILTSTNKEEAKITANKICTAVRNNKFTLVGGEKVNVTISVGVATVGDNGEKPQEIIEFADKCLYVAKENGRNQVISEIN